MLANTIHTPRVAVVMATYNGEKFIEEQLQSIINQTYPNLEIIITDDCSTDGTYSIVQRYASQYPNITCYVNRRNIGYVKNFEKAIKLATADYIALSDQDDVWHPNKIALMMQHINDASVVYCDSEFIDADGNRLNKKLSDIKNLQPVNDSLPFVVNNGVFGHAMLMHKCVALKAMPFPEDCVHDWVIAFVASFANGVKFVNEPAVQYRQHAGNTANTKKRQRCSYKEEIGRIRRRIKALAAIAVKTNCTDKDIIVQLAESYKSFSLINNFKRMLLFFKYRHRLTAFKKKRSEFKRMLFCIKTFYKLV